MKLPDLAELLALRAAAQGLSLHAHRPVLARLQGGHRSAQRGRGLEFEEVRLYAAGDDARLIDWRVTARRGKPHTKLFREERERPVWIVADLHPGLFFGSRLQLKSALLLRAAALLAWVATLDGDRVGGLIATPGLAARILPPRARQAGVLPLLEALIEAQPTAPAATPGSGVNAALAALRPLLQPGSLVLLLSDFCSVNAETEAALAPIAARCDCRLLWLTDPLESGGLPAGQFRLGLPGRLWWLDGKASQTDWRAAWQAREKSISELAQRLALPLTALSTALPVAEALPPLLRESASSA